MGKIALLILIALVVVVLFVPALRSSLTRLTTTSETIILTRTVSNGQAGEVVEVRELKMVTLLGFDAIPAILNPSFVTAEEAEDWLEPDGPVLGVSINGEHRAYAVAMLSRHEIVNDVVGGVPVAVTW